MEQGGISKVNIATDIELCMHDALHLSEHLTQSQLNSLSSLQKQDAQDAVRKLVAEKMQYFVRSGGWGRKALIDLGILQ
jgi:fructose-bisphosphate aldolase class II